MANKTAQSKKIARRNRRRHRIRKSVVGTPERPRLVVYRSLRHIEAQIIDDTVGHSLIGLSTQSKDLRDEQFEGRRAQGQELGKRLAAKAKEAGIDKVIFDRSGFLYHGIIRAVADGAREGGLQF